MRRAQFLLLLAVTLPPEVGAQIAAIPPGTRVSVASSGKLRIEGTLLSQTDDSTAVSEHPGARTSVPNTSITRIQVSEGTSRNLGAARGAMKGGIILGSILGVVGLVASGSEGSDEIGPPAFPIALAVGAASGLAIGGIIGAVVGAERWTTRYSNPALVSLRSPPGGVPGVGVSITFF